nr:transferrin-binding protein-like solute binding protein [Pseudomonadota bacterium]
MKNKIIKTMTCLLAGLTLTACVGAVNLPAGANTNTNAGGSTQLESLLSQVNSRENIVSSTLYTLNGQTSRLPDSVSIGDGDGQFVMIVNGRRYVFSVLEELVQYQVALNTERDSYVIRLERNDLTNALDPNNPKDYLLFSYVASGDNFGSIGEFVTGIQTPPNAIPTTASATYSGRAYAGALDGDVQPLIETAFGVEGDITMNVNFAERTISGEMTNLTEADRIIDIPSGSRITFNQTRFETDGSYDGTVTLSSSLRNALNITSVTRAVYRGDTYGNNAASVAGILEFNGSTTTVTNYYAGGGF